MTLTILPCYLPMTVIICSAVPDGQRVTSPRRKHKICSMYKWTSTIQQPKTQRYLDKKKKHTNHIFCLRVQFYACQRPGDRITLLPFFFLNELNFYLRLEALSKTWHGLGWVRASWVACVSQTWGAAEDLEAMPLPLTTHHDRLPTILPCILCLHP